jgi:hypothetical protein
VAAESTLKWSAHPNFISWSKSNGNRPRIIFLQVIGIIFITLGLMLDVVFIASHLSYLIRIACILLWLPGLTILAAACQGLCILFHMKNIRQLRPWEQAGDLASLTAPETLAAMEPRTLAEEKEALAEAEFRKHTRKDTAASVFSTVDPLRKASLQTFGPANMVDKQPWVAWYANRSLYDKIFEATVPVQNKTLQQMRDRILLVAVVIGTLGSVALTIPSLFIPAANLF